MKNKEDLMLCQRCYKQINNATSYFVLYHKANKTIRLCNSCNNFISHIIKHSVDDIIEEYILRKE